jgi:hypothetical protein
MELTITVDWGEGPHTVRTTPGAIIEWERKTKQKLTNIERVGLGLEDVAFLAHASLRRSGTVVPDFNKFCDALIDITMGDDEPSAPFQEAVSEEK